MQRRLPKFLLGLWLSAGHLCALTPSPCALSLTQADWIELESATLQVLERRLAAEGTDAQATYQALLATGLVVTSDPQLFEYLGFRSGDYDHVRRAEIFVGNSFDLDRSLGEIHAQLEGEETAYPLSPEDFLSSVQGLEYGIEIHSAADSLEVTEAQEAFIQVLQKAGARSTARILVLRPPTGRDRFAERLQHAMLQ